MALIDGSLLGVGETRALLIVPPHLGDHLQVGETYQQAREDLYDRTFSFETSAGTGIGYLMFELNLVGTSAARHNGESMSSFAQFLSPFDVATPPGPLGAQGSVPITCDPRQCAIPFLFGTTVTVRVQAYSRSSYQFTKQAGSPDNQLSGAILSSTEFILTGVGRFDPTQGLWEDLPGARVRIRPQQGVPEPAQWHLLLVGGALFVLRGRHVTKLIPPARA